MKAWMAALMAAWLCAACAQGGSVTPHSGSITMYGTLDQGITVHD